MSSFHAVSNNVRALAPEHEVDVASRNNYALSRLTHSEGGKPLGCQIKHKTPVRDSVIGVVYDIPITRGYHCIGWMDWCMNQRLT